MADKLLSVPESKNDFVKLAKNFDFIHIVFIDIHGIPRVKVLPAQSADNLVSIGTTIIVSIISSSIDGRILTETTTAHIETMTGNIRLRPIIETTRNWPWMGLQTGSRILQIFTAAESLSGNPVNNDTRRMAQTQVKRLHDRGLDIYVGWEVEFRLFKVDDDADGEPVPAHNTVQAFHFPLYKQYESFYVAVIDRIRALGFSFDAFYFEDGIGTLEFALAPQWGMKSLDDLVRLKMIIRDLADDCGYRVSFMTRPCVNDIISNQLQCNHSVWRRTDGKPSTDNAMLDENDSDKMSLFARQWMAGLLHHAKGFKAISHPTVNCYRHDDDCYSSSHADWGIDDRSKMIRLRSDETTYIEHRAVTPPANPYSVVAAIIASGLDGVDRKLPPVDEGSKEMGPLPQTLGQALEALKKDEILSSALSKEFVDWYEAVKMEEVSQLQSVDVTKNRKEDFRKERQIYFDFV